MEHPKLPCNSLCLSDNYIFSEIDNIHLNLIPLFDVLLPEKSDIEFHISIFTLFYYKNSDNSIEIKDISRIVREGIKKIRPHNFKFNLSIIRSSPSNYHDRVILTNNSIIQSGSGFGIFINDKVNDKLRIRHRTTINRTHPITYSMANVQNNGSDIYYYNFLIEKMIEDYNQFINILKQKNAYISFSNRLLEIS